MFIREDRDSLKIDTYKLLMEDEAIRINYIKGVIDPCRELEI